MSIVALIPARGGSKRIPGKNIKPLGGKPLIQWTINEAVASGVFSEIYVASDDLSALDIGSDAGALPFLRPPSSDCEPDITWVSFVLNEFLHWPSAFAILRPTSPFRTADTIRRAWRDFQNAHEIDSLRAVQPVTEHPGKMWLEREGRLYPLMPYEIDGVPWHSRPTQTLPPIWKQNASLEIAWTKTVTEKGSIAGDHVLPFYTDGWEGFDINTPEDWERAERHAADLLARV